jgi:hypothetical protein
MTIKIFEPTPSSSFEGINYNEKKVPDGRSELLVAKNFGMLELNDQVRKSDYIGYMQKVAESNKNVSITQFHAMLSCKGREVSPERLRDIAVEYLDKMGYGQNPYLIYYHSDTAHNHVHMVSTRVSKDGVRVNDSMEWVRSQKIIGDIIKRDIVSEYDINLKEALNYNVSSDAQFRMVMESMGYKVETGKDQHLFYKYGKLQGDIQLGKISAHVKNRDFDLARIEQVKAIVNKYKGLKDSTLTLKSFAKPRQNIPAKDSILISPLSEHLRKMGLEFVFHHKNHLTPYGYSVIDHASKQVYKGSQIMELNQLLAPPSGSNRTQGVDQLIKIAIDTKLGFDSVKQSLKETGLYLNWNGEIRLKGSKPAFYQLSREELNALKYTDRLTQASKYEVSDHNERYIIAGQFFIKTGDLQLIDKSESNKNHIREKVRAVFHNYSSIKEDFKEAGLFLVELGKDTYVVDMSAQIIQNMNNILNQNERSALDHEISSIVPLVLQKGKDIDSAADLYEAPDPSAPMKTNNTDDHSQIVSFSDIKEIFGSIKDEKDPAANKKKKRKRS